MQTTRMALAVVAGLAFGGCSFLVRPKESLLPPVVDTFLAVALSISCITALAQGNPGNGPIPPSVMCVPVVPIAIVAGFSARSGFSSVAAHEANAAR
jgi:hypothetical protein